jgi:hypothetical protein
MIFYYYFQLFINYIQIKFKLSFRNNSLQARLASIRIPDALVSQELIDLRKKFETVL